MTSNRPKIRLSQTHLFECLRWERTCNLFRGAFLKVGQAGISSDDLSPIQSRKALQWRYTASVCVNSKTSRNLGKSLATLPQQLRFPPIRQVVGQLILWLCSYIFMNDFNIPWNRLTRPEAFAIWKLPSLSNEWMRAAYQLVAVNLAFW